MPMLKMPFHQPKPGDMVPESSRTHPGTMWQTFRKPFATQDGSVHHNAAVRVIARKDIHIAHIGVDL